MQNIQGTYNLSAFDGTVTSDFLKLGNLTNKAKAGLIDYSAADFEESRAALLVYLKAIYPTEYNSFAESDLGIMLVEMFAYMSSVLSYKADMIANENFITSVKTPENLRKLLQLIGIKMRGPISSKAGARLVVETGEEISGSESIVITHANRTFSVPSNKDSGMLSFAVYKVDSTGNIDLGQDSITLILSESLNSAGADFSNLILLEGIAQKQTGTFSNTDTIHSINLQTPSITEGSITVVLENGDIYEEIENIFLAGDTSKVFSKTYLDDYSAVLNFGDNQRGRAPDAGTDYTVYYRTGGGDRGNIISNSISIKTPATVAGVTSVVNITNPKMATGGSKSETVEHAKKYGPYFFKTQYRAVTGEDYTSFANHFMNSAGKSGKAQAVLRSSGAGSNMIDIYVIAFGAEVAGFKTQLERASISYKQDLLTYLNEYKMITDEITIVDGLVRTLDLEATIYLDKPHKIFESDIKAKATRAMLKFFDLDTQEFGQDLKIGELNRALFDINEIRFSSIDNIKNTVKLNFNEILQLNNVQIKVVYV
tara:strand:+ start:2909 stop:4528 length:1620 start_codon:yes stop_codon:yes gene_type:complete